MDTVKIIRNSWGLMLHYHALWIFGVVLALTTVSLGSGVWLSGDREPGQPLWSWEISANDQAWIQENFGLDLPLRYTLRVEDLSLQLDDPQLSEAERTRRVNIAIAVLCGLALFLVAGATLRYTAETALIRMVHDQQLNQLAHSARQGWALGFSSAALKLFLIDLVVIPLLLTLTVLIFLPAMLPVLIAINGSPAGITIGVLLMLALILVALAALLVMWAAGIVTLQLARRACCLEGLGIFAAIWRGLRLLRSRVRDVGLTWLIIAGVELVYPLLAAPLAILLAAAGVLVGGLLALALGALLALGLAKATAWTIAVVVGLVLLAVIVALPLTLLEGLREVFISSVWTLTFQEATSPQMLAPAPEPWTPLTQAGAA